MSLKFIIFAHARSGSTNLAQVLREHPSIKIASEPFHRDYHKINPDEKNYIDYIKDEASLSQQLDILFGQYSGLKCLEYQLTKGLNNWMLKDPSIKIIFLQRKNLLQTVVSMYIASETKVWHKHVNKDLEISSFPEIEPVDIDVMKKRLENLRNKLSSYKQLLEKEKKADYLSVYYEDLYTNNRKENIKNAKEVFLFLGLDIPDKQRISVFMDPQKAKMNSHDTYKLVPNIDDVESMLGSDETGWLFK